MGKPLISLAQIAEEDPYYLDIDEKPDWQSQFENPIPLNSKSVLGWETF